ncbi:MAG: DJ-1/PfpI family protein [Verrucomicrobiota bacterium]|nr:DJ-1/PfpI family protein [Verrucomicrobiota bacterium]
MNRRQFLTTVTTAGASLAAGTSPSLRAAEGEAKGLVVQTSKLTPPPNGGIPVAILISENLNVIDFSGPWGVFESVNVPGATELPFHLFTVAETAEVVTSGSGLKLKPDHTFANVPEVKVIVIPAQKGSDAMIDWLRKNALKTDVTMSVCTGAFKLAKAGLLSGKPATTHHEFLDKLEKEYPDIQVKRGVRFVEGEKISTAGGLTSGTDLALRVVERYFGREIAQSAATYMEYNGKGWIV